MNVRGEGDYIYLSLHCHHQNDSCIKMGSDESHFNVSLIILWGTKHKTVSTDHNFWKERRAEADSNRGPAVYQPNALPLSQTDQPMLIFVESVQTNEPELHLEFWSFCYAILSKAATSSAYVEFSRGVFIIHRQWTAFRGSQPLGWNMGSQDNPKCLSRYAFWINVLLKLGFVWTILFSSGKHFIESFIKSDKMALHRLNEFSYLALICDAVLVCIIL